MQSMPTSITLKCPILCQQVIHKNVEEVQTIIRTLVDIFQATKTSGGPSHYLDPGQGTAISVLHYRDVAWTNCTSFHCMPESWPEGYSLITAIVCGNYSNYSKNNAKQ